MLIFQFFMYKINFLYFTTGFLRKNRVYYSHKGKTKQPLPRREAGTAEKQNQRGGKRQKAFPTYGKGREVHKMKRSAEAGP